MGCGCIERGDRWADKAEARGHETAAKILRATPRITDRIQQRAKQAVRGWSVTDLPMSGRTSIGGPGEKEETDSPRRVLRGGTSRRE